ncbi:hypothetical protein SLS56_005616 [Neofusicoccum ribis]|uniref:AB hydrolase-1 domain-containing protein n=1 Tax=Neofusicoccum ribis TaxID=45134 RepID=A0ABR3ST41_9PEZI
MFADFTPFDITTDPANNVTIHGIKGGSGPPLLLLHGFPQTHHIWHRVAPQLTSTYTVIAIDLRGYGASSTPPASASHAAYSKTAMAADAVAVMAAHAGASTPFFVCGHDRGARVAHQLCVEHPALARRALLLDICPTLAMYEQADRGFAAAYWHWFFLIQPRPIPETFMAAARARDWLAMFTLGAKNPDGVGSSFFAEEAFAEYVRAAERPGAIEAYCEDYRAAATVDCEEQKRDREAGKKIKCDLRVLWGRKGVIEKFFKALEEWRKVCEGEVSGEAVDSGHYVPEEVPDVVVRNIKEFFV